MMPTAPQETLDSKRQRVEGGDSMSRVWGLAGLLMPTGLNDAGIPRFTGFLSLGASRKL